MPNVQDPFIEGTRRVVFEGEDCGVGRKSANGIKMVREDGGLCRAVTGEERCSRNCIHFAM